jgi:hypothetical protein
MAEAAAGAIDNEVAALGLLWASPFVDCRKKTVLRMMPRLPRTRQDWRISNQRSLI